MRRARLRALVPAVSLVALGLFAASPASALERFEPPDGRIYSGVSTRGVTDKYQGFLDVSAQPRVAIYNRFGGQGLTDFRWIFNEFSKIDAAGMISWQLFPNAYDPSVPGGSQQSIARGDIDAYILARAAEVRAYGKPLFIRLNWEMNGNWFPFSAYNRQGVLQEGNAHVHYRNAWRRTVEIFKGGTKAQINARLADLGLPGLTTADASVPATANVAWVWCPHYETKVKDKQTVWDYYPGDDYVDWVGVDWYPWASNDVGYHAKTASGPNEVYNRLSAPGTAEKPFMIGEWGQFGYDRPAWTQDMFSWIAARPAVKGQLYFNIDPTDKGGGEQNSELQAFPLAAAAFRQGVSGSKWIRSGAEVRDYAPEPVADTAAPVVTLASPAQDATIEAPTVVDPAVTDDRGVVEVRYLLDGSLVASLDPPDDSYEIRPAGLAEGAHTLRIEAEDAAGNVGVHELRFSVPPPPDTAAPVVTLAAPVPGSTLSATTTVVPGVTDDRGVAEVRFVLDGALVDTDAPGEAAYDIVPGALAAGSHVLRIEASDAAGNTGAYELPFSVSVPAPPPPPPSTETAYVQGSDGRVVMEAERADAVVGRSGKTWKATPRAGAVGGAMSALSDTGSLWSMSAAPTKAPELRFRVRFTKAGTYRLAVRGLPPGGGGDSVHVGLNGVLRASADGISGFPTFTTWSWASASAGGPTPATISVPSAGLHTVNVWAREDGVVLDRIVIAPTGTATPTGSGPAESARG